MAVSYVPLDQSGYFSGANPDLKTPTFNTGSVTSLFASTSFLYTLGIMICVVAGGVMYARAGLIRMQASEQGVRKSNEEIKRVTIGLLGILSLFVIIYTFNRDILRGDVGLDAFRTNTKMAPVTTGSSTGTTSTTSTPFIPKNNDDPEGWNAIKNDPPVRAQLAALPNGGITVNKSVCTTPTQTSCTTVGGWPQSTIDMLSQLRQTCPGNIAVTGGTEAGHQSHGPGKRPVDVSLNDNQLESCIRSFPAGPQLSFCYKTYQRFGYVFCDEISVPRHWHIQ